MSEDMQKMPGTSERVSKDMQEIISEEMPQRMSEDVPDARKSARKNAD